MPSISYYWHWLRLSLAPIPKQVQQNIIHHWGDPACFFEQSQKEWRSSILHQYGDDKGMHIVKALSTELEPKIEKALLWQQESGNHLLLNHTLISHDTQNIEQETTQSTHYPQQLSILSDAPIVLYAKGDSEALKLPSLAIVGSRSASLYGERLAEEFSQEMAQSGIAIISGLALGIDAASHRGALKAHEHGGASTIAVLATGPNIIYPSKNRALARTIANRGLILTEYPLDTKPRTFHFPQRNRLIAALSLGCLVVEASARSGALITARIAAELGREVFAIPGSVHSPMSRGSHRLLREGAKLVEQTQDIFEELHTRLIPFIRASEAQKPPIDQSLELLTPSSEKESTQNEEYTLEVKKTPLKKRKTKNPPSAKKPKPSKAASPHTDNNTTAPSTRNDLLERIPYSPTVLDEIVAVVECPLADLHALLLQWEIEGAIESLPGGRFQRLR